MMNTIPELPGARDPDNDETEVQFGLPTEELELRLAGLELMDLLRLRQILDAKLPVKSLEDLDLAQEMVMQMQALSALQTVTLQSKDVKANQKAQVANSLSQSLATLVKLQGSIYSSERFKRLEAIMVGFINSMPESKDREHALEVYEREVRGVFGG